MVRDSIPSAWAIYSQPIPFPAGLMINILLHYFPICHGTALVLLCSPSIYFYAPWAGRMRATKVQGRSISAPFAYHTVGYESLTPLGLTARGRAKGSIHRNGLPSMQEPVPFSPHLSRADDQTLPTLSMSRACSGHSINILNSPVHTSRQKKEQRGVRL